MQREEFLKYALNYYSEKYPELEITDAGDFHLNVKGGHYMFLEPYYMESKASNFENIDEMLEKLIKLTKLASQKNEFKWEDVETSVYPQIKMDFQLKVNLPSGEVTDDYIVFVDFFETIKCVFVIDKSDSFFYITKKTMDKMGISLETLKAAALRNLAKQEELSHSIKSAKNDNGYVTLIYSNSKDAYDAARILLPKFIETAEKEFGPNFLVGIPDRDFLIAGSVNNAMTIQKMVLDMYHQSGHRILPCMLLYKNSNWSFVKIDIPNDQKN